MLHPTTQTQPARKEFHKESKVKPQTAQPDQPKPRGARGHPRRCSRHRGGPTDREIGQNTQNLLEAISDFASISLVNARLFRAVEQTDEASKLNDKNRNAMLESLRESIREEMQVSMYPLEALISVKAGPLTAEQEQALKTIQNSVRRLSRAAEKTVPPPAAKTKS